MALIYKHIKLSTSCFVGLWVFFFSIGQKNKIGHKNKELQPCPCLDGRGREASNDDGREGEGEVEKPMSLALSLHSIRAFSSQGTIKQELTCHSANAAREV